MSLVVLPSTSPGALSSLLFVTVSRRLLALPGALLVARYFPETAGHWTTLRPSGSELGVTPCCRSQAAWPSRLPGPGVPAQSAGLGTPATTCFSVWLTTKRTTCRAGMSDALLESIEPPPSGCHHGGHHLARP
jgi:hypothetical protein